MKAIKFEIIFGINPGYFHNNREIALSDAQEIVALEWQKALEEEFSQSNILVGAFISAGRVVYPVEFGCPKGGEIVVAVCGNSNPQFTAPEELLSLKEAIIRVAKVVKRALGQKRVQITFSEVFDFVYLEPE